MHFSIGESKENDLIIKAATGNISQTIQAVRINDQGAPLLGLANLFSKIQVVDYYQCCVLIG